MAERSEEVEPRLRLATDEDRDEIDALMKASTAACESAARDEGFTGLALMATLPGFPLYVRYGFLEVERESITLPDGVVLEGVAMEKEIEP